jgi:hypothetical protein
MTVPKKTGVSLCSQCFFVCKNEEYRLLHRFLDGAVDAELIFCGRECMMDYFEEELFLLKIEAACAKEREDFEKEKTGFMDWLKKEHSYFLQHVCPACKRRIVKLAARLVPPT